MLTTILLISLVIQVAVFYMHDIEILNLMHLKLELLHLARPVQLLRIEVK